VIWLFLALQDFESIPLPRVSIEFSDALVSDVCAEVSKQARYPVRWDGSQTKTITITMRNASLLEVAAEMAKILGCNLSEVSTGEGMTLRLPASFFNPPVLAYQVRGPALVCWYGLTMRDKTTRYYTGFFCDRRASTFRVRDLPVTFTIDGKSFEVKSDHNPNVFTSDRVAWEFESNKLSGARALFEVTVPCTAPSEAPSVMIPAGDDQSVKASGAIVSIEGYKREDKGVLVEYSAALRVAPAKKDPAVNPTLTAVYLHGPGQERLVGKIENGKLSLQTRDMNFKPEQIEIVWTQNPKEFKLPFKFEVPLK
jgi:hypothetical protein